jgi:hypothetical protein
LAFGHDPIFGELMLRDLRGEGTVAENENPVAHVRDLLDV